MMVARADVVRTGNAAGASGKQNDQRPQPLAASVHDVAPDLLHQGDAGGKLLGNQIVDAIEVFADEIEDGG